MPNPIMPHADLQDSSMFRVVLENPAIRSKPEDGLEMSRYKHTRTPRRTFSSGFTDISEAVRLDLDDFWEVVHGGSLIFDWTNPADLTVHQVRFTEPIEFKYVGQGALKRWNVFFRVQQA